MFRATPTVSPHNSPGSFTPTRAADVADNTGTDVNGPSMNAPVEGPALESPSTRAWERHRTAIVIGSLFVLGGGFAACVVGLTKNDASHSVTTPAATPDHKFVRDMNDAFDAKMNPGKNPIADIWTYRIFKDGIANTGHDICGYLGSHNYDEDCPAFQAELAAGLPERQRQPGVRGHRDRRFVPAILQHEAFRHGNANLLATAARAIRRQPALRRRARDEKLVPLRRKDVPDQAGRGPCRGARPSGDDQKPGTTMSARSSVPPTLTIRIKISARRRRQPRQPLWRTVW